MITEDAKATLVVIARMYESMAERAARRERRLASATKAASAPDT
jgi:hypothetical protein